MRHISAQLIAAIRALPACEVTGDQPAPNRDSHSYATHVETYIATFPAAPDLAWAVAGLAICHAEATQAAHG